MRGKPDRRNRRPFETTRSPLHSDGLAEAFDTDGIRIAKDRDELVIRLALNPDSDIDEEQA